MASKKPHPLRYDDLVRAEGAAEGIAFTRQPLLEQLESVRKQLAAGWEAGAVAPPPTSSDALSATERLARLPHQVLDDYEQNRHGSQLGRLLKAAQPLAEEVDRLVVVAEPGIQLAIQSVVATCCHPLHNELSRGERGARPRIYYVGHGFDNDTTQGLLDLLGRDTGARPFDQQWGLVLVDSNPASIAPAVAARQFLAALVESCGGNATAASRRVVAISAAGSSLADIAPTASFLETLTIPPQLSESACVFTAAALFPWAVLGIDIVSLLRGARNMTNKLLATPAQENPVLRMASLGPLHRSCHPAGDRVWVLWNESLQRLSQWYAAALREGLAGRIPRIAPAIVGPVREVAQLHSPDAPRDRLVTQLSVDHVRRDRLPVGAEAIERSGVSIPGPWHLAALQSVAQQLATEAIQAHQPMTASIALPILDEYGLGQVMQMLLLATALEAHLAQVEPFGPADYQRYNQRFTNILRSKE